MSSNVPFGTILSGNRKRNHEFNDIQRALIINEKTKGRSYRDVAQEFNTSPSTVHKIVKRWIDDSTISKKPRSGRPNKVSETDIKYILLLLKRDRQISYDTLNNALGGQLSRTTIKRIIRKCYGRKWRSMQRIPLSNSTARERLLWAQGWDGEEDQLMEV